MNPGRFTIVEGVRLLEVLAGQPRQPNYLIYVERHDDAGSQRLQEQLQAYREGSRPKEKADYVLKWSLQDPTLIPTPTSPATTLDIVHVMSELAGTRPVFHSEADFQHALACCIHSSLTDGDARLEYKPDPIKPVYLDLWLAHRHRNPASARGGEDPGAPGGDPDLHPGDLGHP